MENSSPNPSFSICDIQIQKQISRSFGKSFPQKIVLPKLRPHCSATCLNTWKAEPRKKNTPCISDLAGVKFLLKKERVFFFRGCRGSARQWRNDSFIIRVLLKIHSNFVQNIPPKNEIGFGCKNMVGTKRRLFCIPPKKS